MTLALNTTRNAVLAGDLRVADTYWSRLCGLLITPEYLFRCGAGLWIEPSRGVHTLGMRYAIDALYLDGDMRVIHIQEKMAPWRCGVVRRNARGVLELPAGTVARTGTCVGDGIAMAAEAHQRQA